MLMLVFVFMLLNFTIIWKLPTFSIGGRGCDGILRVIGPRAGFFIRGCAQKAALGTILGGQPPAMIPSHAVLDSSVSHLPS